MVDLIFDLLFTSASVWIGLIIGIVIAACIYFFFPESEIKNMLAMGAVALGYFAGIIFPKSRSDK